MSTVIPPAFAFHFAIPVRYAGHLPRKNSPPLDLGDEFQILWPDASLFGRAQVPGPPTSGVDLRIGWNERGIGIAYSVRGKTQAIFANSTGMPPSDGLLVCLDTRNTQTIHRASRFCHLFLLQPTGNGDDEQQPAVRQQLVPRAAEDAKLHEPEAFRIARRRNSDGYDVEAWLPAATLTGFDIEVCSQLGFTCLLLDRELGDVPFTVGSEFPITSDPSLWQTLDLMRG